LSSSSAADTTVHHLVSIMSSVMMQQRTVDPSDDLFAPAMLVVPFDGAR
jgi:hypothetical protein